MFNALIVDDDFRDRNGICNVIKKQKMPLISFTASCGSEALTILKNEKIDILITDIKMPDMLGTDLALFARKNYPYIKIILISAYKDFEYAQSAIKSGVINYLLKPYSLDELIETIQKSIDQCSDKSNYLSHLNSPIDTNILTDDAILKILTNVISPTQKQLTNLIPKNGLQIIILKILTNIKENDTNIIFDHIKESFEDNIRIISKSKYEYLIFKPYTNYLSTESLKNIIDGFQTKFSIKTCIVYSPVITFHDEMTTYFKKAKQISEILFFLKKSVVVSATDDILEPKKAESISIDLFLEKLNLFIKMNNYDDFISSLRDFFDILQKTSHYSPLYIKSISATLASKLLKNTSVESEQKITVKIFETDFLDDIIHIFESIVEDLTCKTSENSTHRLIAKTLSIIEKEYMNDISLEYIANKIYISPSYLSHLFKKETGKNFIEYLRDFRLQKSKNLLLNSNLKITEICEKVGYDSSSYFYTLFRDTYGITPAQFREKGDVKIDKKDND